VKLVLLVGFIKKSLWSRSQYLGNQNTVMPVQAKNKIPAAWSSQTGNGCGPTWCFAITEC